MEMSFIHRAPSRKGVCIVVFVVALAYVVAIAHGVMTIDVARDLFWAIEIARARAWPLVGPPVGPFELLSAIWYYVAAGTAVISSSLTMYFALLGALAALKYVLMYRVALRWLDARFALILVVAATLPGVASYQFFGISHPQFVEVTIWATALFALRLRATPEATRDALGLGACAALSLHAHPTAILLLPWALVAVLSLPKLYRIRATLAAMFAAAVVFLPLIVAFLLGVSSASENVPGTSGMRGSIAGLVPLLQNLFWFQSAYLVDTMLPAVWFASAWPTLWALLLILSAIGAAVSAADRRLRATFWASLLTFLGVLIGVTLLRDHTPFYMLYVALPPLAALFASAWMALRNIRCGSVVVAVVLASVGALHIGMCAGYVYAARNGMVASRLPLHSNMQDTTTTTHTESISASPTRDAIANWLCSQPGAVALHGDLAATNDIGLGQEQFFHCRNRGTFATAGGAEKAWTGLPLPVWHELASAPTVVLGSYGMMHATEVISPKAALPPVSARAYPPRFTQMVAAANLGLWQTQVQTKSGALLVVSSLLPTYPLFSVSATANGVAQQALSRFANTSVFRCGACAESAANWIISVEGGAPDSTSITVLNAEPKSHLSASLRR